MTEPDPSPPTRRPDVLREALGAYLFANPDLALDPDFEPVLRAYHATGTDMKPFDEWRARASQIGDPIQYSQARERRLPTAASPTP